MSRWLCVECRARIRTSAAFAYCPLCGALPAHAVAYFRWLSRVWLQGRRAR